MASYEPPPSGSASGVTSYNTRTGAVTAQKSDVTGTGLLATSATSIGVDVPLGATATTILTTPVLAAGTWLILAGVTLTSSATSQEEVDVILGTAVGTFAGQQSAQTQSQALTTTRSASISCVVTITTPGTLILSGMGSGAGSTARATTSPSSLPNATGIVAVNLA